jgi:hypothetical protein
VIRNQASIVFDANPPVVTTVCPDEPDPCPWTNTLDSTAPTSTILGSALEPEQTSSCFDLEWSGSDEGAGVKDYTLFVSEDGGAFTEWVRDTSETVTTFCGRCGRTYAFYSVARDRAGNVEKKNVPSGAEAVTTVVCSGGQRPGDCNQDGKLNMSDGICLLSHLFLGEPSELPCGNVKTTGSGTMRLLDGNGDGKVNLSDAVGVFQFLFQGATPPVLGTECIPIEGCPDNPACQ